MQDLFLLRQGENVLMRGLGDAIISSDFDASLLDSVLHDACSAAG